MNLAPCPDCKTMISRSATACPKCGRPITPADLPPPPKREGFPVGTVIVAAIVVIIILLLAMKASNDKQEDQRIRERILDTERKRSGG